ncbi:unnamed protein product [Rhizoctonia solani]|uniref:C2H2-type domain-containing protein n=1 Tax=Rhizoctonia solani TaxID=456999 RepID=A0A8H3A2Q9_9AGAM|nr:unnamed protein product [Rhizoctonia solani]CAE6488114.1 unnamed protein product [Rhizoctonia solani]
MESSTYFLDGNYNSFAQGTTSLFDYEGVSFEHNQLDTFWGNGIIDTLNDYYSNEHIAEDLETCNPSDVMGEQVDFGLFVNDEWSETVAPPTGADVLIAPDEFIPAQLMTPSTLVATPVLPVPSTPRRPSVRATAASVSNTGMLSPPPSDRPVRTRRHNAYDEICQLSNLGLNTPRSKKPTTSSTAAFATPLPPASRVLKTPVDHDIEMRYLSPPSCYSSSSSGSSATFSPIDSPSSGMSDSFGSPLSPPETPVRCPTRRSGVDRPRVARRGSGEKSYFHPYGDPAPSGERERPHGCRHPGNIVPGDVPCDKNFARMHDWVRHQRVHTGQTPYKCLSCGKEFKRSDARGRHWDGKSGCEAYHMNTIRERLVQGQITAEHPDVPILRRRAQKAEYRKESDRTGVPVQDLKTSMPQVKHEDIVGPGF